MTREEYFANLKQAEDALHYGVGHLQGGHSGRYPYGSGDKKEYKQSLRQDKKARTAKTLNVYDSSKFATQYEKKLQKHTKKI